MLPRSLQLNRTQVTASLLSSLDMLHGVFNIQKSQHILPGGRPQNIVIVLVLTLTWRCAKNNKTQFDILYSPCDVIFHLHFR